tara:strand:- start:1762 stop:1968 length:207 start_codon:yes stop_codon:yes gene_type:complete
MISEINPEHIKLLENCFKKWRHFYHEEILHEMWCRYVEYENYYENYWSREAERWWAAGIIQNYWKKIR